MSSKRGFTLVELLVVIGIIAVLIGVLLPALSRARQQASRVRAMSDLRELVTGYTQYHLSNRGALLLGQPPSRVNGWNVVAESTEGGTIGSPLAQRYPFRLIRYVGNVWGILWSHHPTPTPDPSITPYSDALADADYRKSLRPCFGLNTVFLGGHEGGVYKGYVTDTTGGSGARPNVNSHVAFRANEVRRASTIIVFAESRITPLATMDKLSLPPEADDDGAYYLMPPRGNSPAPSKRWWSVTADGKACKRETKTFGGLPNTRFGKGGTLVAFFDGHVGSLLPRELEDMRYWCPRTNAADFDFK